MNRRHFLLALGFILWLENATRGAAQERIPRIGFLTPFPAAWPSEEGFHQGLRVLGYVEGKNLLIEWRRATESYADLRPLAIELVRATLTSS